MDYRHNAPASPGPHPMEQHHIPLLAHPQTGEVYSHRVGVNAHLLRPQTQSESLQPSDPRRARNITFDEERGFFRRIFGFFTGR